ncbi:MAG: L-threonylcarbamoyladenylate synthase [Candidatus Hodarchaeota archaeon]
MTRRQAVDPQNPDQRVINEVAALIQQGGLVVLPTDTAYGLAGDPQNPTVVNRVLTVKRRVGKPGMPLLVASLAQARRFGNFSKLAEALATRFWPGALTLVVPTHHTFPTGILGPQNSLALRIPNHPVALAVIQTLKAPVIGTSANKSTAPSPRSAEAAIAQMGDAVDLVLDAGPTPLSKDSTIINCTITPPEILRRGALPVATLRPLLDFQE